MEKVGFNIMMLIEEQSGSGERFISPIQETFKDIEESFHILMDNIFYEVKVVKKDAFIWFEFDFGKPDPIDYELTNIKTGEKKDNPRTQEEAELTNQLFVLYDFGTKKLYLSNLNKEKTFTQMLTEKLDKSFIIKRFYKTKEDFISILKDVKEISFTDAKDLFNQDTKRRQALIDLTGTNAPDKFTLNTQYPKGSNIKHFIMELFESRCKNELNDLVIKGTDEDNFTFIYNVETFIQKIIIQVAKNIQGTYDSEIVRKKLIKALDNER